MTALTRGPRSARVYWRRRLVVLLVLAGLVIGTARLFSLGSDASSEETPRATQVAAESSDSPTATSSTTSTDEADPEQRPGKQRRGAKGKKPRRDRAPVLAEPDGVCSDRDIAVTPSVRNPVGGSAVTFTLELRTITTPACTWRASPTTLTMKITSGDDDIWSSQDCPRAIPRRDLVVRNNASTEVEVTWSGKRSDDDCSALTQWALPGWYHVDVAALAGEPSDLHFELLKPEPGVEIETVKPDREPKQRDRDRDRKSRDEKSRDGKKRDGNRGGGNRRG